MSESQLIGRQSQLNTVQQQIYHCLSGQPRVLLMEGLAGIGVSACKALVLSGQRNNSCKPFMRRRMGFRSLFKKPYIMPNVSARPGNMPPELYSFGKHTDKLGESGWPE